MLENLKKDRLKKKTSLEKTGIDVYPANVKKTHSISQVLKSFSALKKSKKNIVVVGRIFAIRGQGGVAFLDLKDEHSAIQIILRSDNTKNFQLIRDNLDIGDFIESRGISFITKKGQQSIDATEIKIIAKSLRPIPSEFYGIKDEETRQRQQYLELLLDKKSRDLFYKKSVFWNSFREFLLKENFLEVQTPVLEHIPGGADAEPFTTHHKALDIDMYLRISLEISLKKLLVAGFEQIFEIGRVFRNEGIDAEHLQDYTQIEYYWAYKDYQSGMRFVEKLFKYVIKKTTGSLKTKRGDLTLDWSKPWPEIDYFTFFKNQTGLDLNTASDSDLRAYAKKQNLDPSKHPGRGRVIDLIFKKIRPKIIQPSFLINPPIDIEPLAKKLKSNPNQVERFQVMASGTELGKGFTELNDPIDQRERFEEQMMLREKGDKEAQRLDEEFLESMEYGMPPSHGFGASERLFSVLMDKPIRETVFFPTLRPRKK